MSDKRWSVGEFERVGDGCYRSVCEPASVNIGLIAGSDGYVLVDAGACVAQGRAIRAAAEELVAREHGGVPLVGVIVTHDHWDHAYGLAAFDGVRSVAHNETLASLATREPWPPDLDDVMSEEDREPCVPSEGCWLGVPISLGDVHVEVIHGGPAHTQGDVFVSVDGGRVVYAGDLVEAEPSIEDRSDVAGWARALITLAQATARREAVVVPGHGDVVDRGFVVRMQAEMDERSKPAGPAKPEWQLPLA